MNENTLKLTNEEKQGLAVLGRVAKKIPRRAHSGGIQLGRMANRAIDEVDQNEVLVFVMSAAGALVGRIEVRGGTPDLRTLPTLLMGAEIAAERLSKKTAAPPPPLSAVEAELLDNTGFVAGPKGAEALERACIELEILLRDSLSLEEAARELGVTTGRLRQRLSPNVRTLYGVKVDSRIWHIPRFQFSQNGGLVRNLDKVLPSISQEAHPLSVFMWFTSPHQDLTIPEHEGLATPIAWLDAGYDPAMIAKLAVEV